MMTLFVYSLLCLSYLLLTQYFMLLGPHLQNMIEDNVESTRFSIEFHNLCILVLQEDILALSSENNNRLSQSSINHMKSVAHQFFMKSNSVSLLCENIDDVNAKLSQLYQMNHLRRVYSK